MATRILVVDDNPQTRRATNHFLSSLGHIVIAASGAHAVAAIRRSTPDIVLTEVLMPSKCGIELIKDIKRENKNIRIIATSAGGLLDRGYLLKMARELGADVVLPKPFTTDQLLATIEQVLKSPRQGDRKDAL